MIIKQVNTSFIYIIFISVTFYHLLFMFCVFENINSNIDM